MARFSVADRGLGLVPKPGAKGATGATGATGPAGLLPLWINVKSSPYNAAGDGVTDDTTAIQAAIDACAAAGGGTVFFPVGSYLIGGPLVTTGGYCSQLKMTPVTGNGVVRLLGAIPMTPFVNNAPSTTKGSWIVSTSAGATYAANGKLPSVLGAPIAQTGSSYVCIQHLAFMLPINPKLAAINMQGAYRVQIDGVLCNTQDYANSYSTQPSNPTGIGLLMPIESNGDMHKIGLFMASGFYTGMIFGEHVSAQHVVLNTNYVGLGWQDCTHASWFGYLSLAWNANHIGFSDYTGVGLTPASSGQGLVTIDNCDFETGGGFAPAWASTSTHIYDNGRLRGKMNWYDFGVGRQNPGSGTYPTLAINSHTALQPTRLDDPLGTSSRLNLYPSPQAISSGVETALTWAPLPGQASWDALGVYTVANTDRLTINVDGLYLFEVFFYWAISSAGNVRIAKIIANGVSDSGPMMEDIRNPVGGGLRNGNSLSGTAWLRGGDYVRITVYQDSGGSLNVDTPDFPHVTVTRIG